MEETLIVLTTTGSAADARTLGRALVEEKLAACVNVVPIESIYPWEGAIQEEQECLLVIKTASVRLHELEERLLRLHPYSAPEFVAIPTTHVADAYKSWLMNWIS
jgi:periplasmic divalent cation tolerance protein